MILSDGEIKEALANKAIVIDPAPSEKQYNASAVDLRLKAELYRLKTFAELQAGQPPGAILSLDVDPVTIDIQQFLKKYTVAIDLQHEGYFRLMPQTFALGMTDEYVSFPKISQIAARVEGRSTLARLGLTIHMTAPTIHCSFSGRILLEMYNFGEYPLRLAPGMAICQLILERLGRAPESDIKTAFMNQENVVKADR
jgi:dCTP deaminase